MLKLKLDLSGKDSIFLSNCHRYCNALAVCELYRNPPDQFPHVDELTGDVNHFQNLYEAATNGDRIQIGLRNRARKQLTEKFGRVTLYLQSVAQEDDIPALLQVGYEVRRNGIKKRTVVAPQGG